MGITKKPRWMDHALVGDFENSNLVKCTVLHIMNGGKVLSNKKHMSLIYSIGSGETTD